MYTFLAGLPANLNTDDLKRVWNNSKTHNLHGITLLSSLLRTEADVLALNARLKVSAYERDLALFLVEHRQPKISSDPQIPLLPYKQLVIKSSAKISNTIEWIGEVLKYNNSPLLAEFLKWQVPKFPVSGTTLKEHGVASGRVMGYVLNQLKGKWAESNFTLSECELVKYIPDVLQDSERKKIKKK